MKLINWLAEFIFGSKEAECKVDTLETAKTYLPGPTPTTLYLWQPTEDLTVHELSLFLSIVIFADHIPKDNFRSQPLIEAAGISKHFKVVKLEGQLDG